MTAAAVTIAAGFGEAERETAARLYWEAFGAKLGRALGPPGKVIAFLCAVMDPRFAIAATGPDGGLLGLAGFKTAEGALVGAGFRDLSRHYGLCSATWRALLLSMLEREPAPDTLQMDGIAVAPAARGQGVGGRLLEAICAEAARRGLSAVQLDVIDSNPRARALYERSGFRAIGVQRAGLLAPLLGFRQAVTMRRCLATSPPRDG